MTEVFVFGSNLAGRHGKGAALHAKQYYGAVYGQGVGAQGSSYAIPTKDHNLKTLPLREIEVHVHNFLNFAIEHPEFTFRVTPIGCSSVDEQRAGYKPEQILPLFLFWCVDDNGTPLLPENVILPQEFIEVINNDYV